jgi:hypothetical protein
VLSAGDLEEVLRVRTPKRVDPEGRYRWRDLLVLYIAWLSVQIEAAVAADAAIPVSAAEMSWRYTEPGWRSGNQAFWHAEISRMFDEGMWLARNLGDAIARGGGMTHMEAASALSAARDSEISSLIEGCLREAVAAAAAHANELLAPGRRVVVFDMGAGTTDIAAIGVDESGVKEIDVARRTADVACDAIDQILVDLILGKGPREKKGQASTLWKTAALAVREQKESLFRERQMGVRYGDKVIRLKLSDLEGNVDYKGVRKSLATVYGQALSLLCEPSQLGEARELIIAPVGGGAAFGLVQDIVKKERPRAKVSVRLANAAPNWTNAPAFGGALAPIFPQLAVAIGGALAPSTLLAAASPAPARTR